MTFDKLRSIKPGIWVKQISTGKFFIRMFDESTPDHQLSVDEMNVCSGGFFDIETGQIVHASHLIDDAKPQFMKSNHLLEALLKRKKERLKLKKGN